MKTPNKIDMNSRYAKSKGFTLIELIVVIILLGILASTALPKLINLRSDAKAGNLQAIKGSMESALQLVYSRAVIKGENIGNGNISINGTNIPLYNGYPSVDGKDSFVDTNNQLRAWLNIDSTDRDTAKNNRNAAPFFTDKNSRQNHIFIFFIDNYELKSINFKCQVRYENPVTTTPLSPIVTALTDSC